MGGMISGVSSMALGIENGTQTANASDTSWNLTSDTSARAVQQAQELGEFNAAKARTQGTQTIAAQKTAYAAGGVDEKTGTAAQVEANTAATSEQNAQVALNNAARQVWGLKQQRAVDYANYQSAQGAAERTATGQTISGAAQVVNSATSLAGG